MDRRGHEITFIKGKYQRYHGWINNEGGESPQSYPVIVNGFKKKDGTAVDRPTKVRKDSVRKRHMDAPNSYEEAVIQQVHEVEAKMCALCKILAKCGINAGSTNIQDLFKLKLQEAVVPRKISYAAPVWCDKKRQTNTP
jgi:hypothetical protein